MSIKEQNEIEQQFYNTYRKNERIDIPGSLNENNLEPKIQIGPYVVDFLYDKKFVIEIDGHEYHKSKEQRFSDYNRERYLMKLGYFVIRFMATEVFIDADKCVRDMMLISSFFQDEIVDAFEKGRHHQIALLQSPGSE